MFLKENLLYQPNSTAGIGHTTTGGGQPNIFEGQPLSTDAANSPARGSSLKPFGASRSSSKSRPIEYQISPERQPVARKNVLSIKMREQLADSPGGSSPGSSPAAPSLPHRSVSQGVSQAGAQSLQSTHAAAVMDENCRKDLPSPKRASVSRDEPKSPPKSVRFTDEDAEVIDQHSTDKRKKERKSSDSPHRGVNHHKSSLKHSSASHESGEESALRSSSRSEEESSSEEEFESSEEEEEDDEDEVVD